MNDIAVSPGSQLRKSLGKRVRHKPLPAYLKTWNLLKDTIFLVLLISTTIVVTYFYSGVITIIWYLAVLVLYSVSKNEALWLAFFLSTVDGFMGFMGLYSITLRIIPDLPGIELAQFYVVIALIKAISKRKSPGLFYFKYLQVMFFYVIFMILWGQISGFSGGLNTYLRVLKLVLPLTLFYSIPVLFSDEKSYERFFSLVFFILIVAFLTQLFTLLTGIEPAGSTYINEELFSEPGTFRGFFNAAATLLSLFGALYYLSLRDQKAFSQGVLYLVISSALGMAIISATRGWIIGLSMVLIIQATVLFTMGRKSIPWLVIFIIVVFIAGMSNPKIRKQVEYSRERVMTLSSITEGDSSASKTLYRLNVRGPTVMNVWKQKPLFGWGFSDTFWIYGDGHVGNQNILLFSGIVGFLLLIGFLIWFSYIMLRRFIQSRRIRKPHPGFLAFPVFLLGWFVIHSTSGQQFGFSGLPLHIIPQAVFFSFGALLYQKSKKLSDARKI